MGRTSGHGPSFFYLLGYVTIVLLALRATPVLDLPSTYFYDGSGTFVAQESAQIQNSCKTGSTSVLVRQPHGPHTGAQCNRTVGETPLGFYFAGGSPAAACIGDSHHVHVAQAALEVCLQKAQQILDDLLWIVRQALVGGDQRAGQSVKGWLASGCPAEWGALALPERWSGPAKAQSCAGTPSTSCGGTGIGPAVARASLTSQIADSPAAQGHWEGEGRSSSRHPQPGDGDAAAPFALEHEAAFLGGHACRDAGGHAEPRGDRPSASHEGAPCPHFNGGGQPAIAGGAEGVESFASESMGRLPTGDPA